MNGWSALDRLLRTHLRDVGCAEAMELLHGTSSWRLRTPGRRNATRASQLTCARAGHAARISTGCWRRCAAQRTDRHPDDPALAAACARATIRRARKRADMGNYCVRDLNTHDGRFPRLRKS